MRVFLTGGSGFLGGRITEELVRGGHEVVLSARTPETLSGIPEGVEVVKGDLSDVASMRAAMAGADAVIHTAALVKRWVRDRSLFDRINVEACAELVDLAWDLGVEKVLYCSSFMALGPTPIRSTGDETTAHDGRPRNDYERTKLLSDRRARRRQEKGEKIVVLYPGVIYGPGRLTDGNILADGAIKLLAGKLPGTIGAGDRFQCFSFVDDVARGFLLALEKAEPGSRYVLGGENLRVRDALSIMAEAGGVELPEREIPYGLASWIGKLMRWSAYLTGIEPQLTDEEVEIYKLDWSYSSAKAQQELGYEITPAKEGLTRMVRWLIETGQVPAGRGHGR